MAKLVSKSLTISKIVYPAVMAPIHNSIINESKKSKNILLWGNPNPKIKHGTLSNKYENDGVKSVDIIPKLISLRYSWTEKLYDGTLHLIL